MILSEILQLDLVQASIKKIDFFLADQAKMSDEYIIALAHKARVLHATGKSSDALKLLFPIVVDFKKISVDAIIAVCDAIIDICLAAERFDQVAKYIAIKKNNLPVSKQILNVKDNIKYYLAINDNQRAKEALSIYLKDDLTLEEECYAKEILADIYYIEKQYDNYLQIAKELDAYYQAQINLEKMAEIGFRQLYIASQRGNHVKVICDGNYYLQEDFVSADFKIRAAALIIKSYLACYDAKKASIIESDYEELIESVKPESALEFAHEALNLYKATNSKSSIAYYENIIKNLSNSFEKPEKKQRKKEIKAEIDIPEEENIDIPEEVIRPRINTISIITEEEENAEPVQSSPVIKAKKEFVQTVKVSENFVKLSKVFSVLNNLDLNVKFREVFRKCCIEICKLYEFSEIYLLYYKREFLGIQYKKERAYDKKINFDDIEDTLNLGAYSEEKELFLDPEIENYQRNIVTGNNYDVTPFGFALPLFEEDNAVGSIAFFSEKPFLDVEMLYENLKLIVSVLNSRLLTYLKQDFLESNNNKLYFISEKMSSGIKEASDGYLYFSPQAMTILGTYDILDEKSYINQIKSSYVAEYKRIQTELKTLMTMGLEYEYEILKNGEYIKVKERYYPYARDGVITIYSLIDDISEAEKEKEELKNIAYKNPISHMNTEVKLILDLNKYYPEKKLALAVCEIQEFKLYEDLYGLNLANQLIYTIGIELNNAFDNDFYSFVYHLGRDRFAILINKVNDKRAVDSRLMKAFTTVSKRIFELNSRFNLLFKCGVYRLAASASISDVSTIINYASDAIRDAHGDEPNHYIAHFNNENYKERFYENGLVTHISEAIDHGLTGITYKQMVDLETTSVYGYFSMINLDNYEIEKEKMDYVIKRRNLSERCEKYNIMTVCKELKMLYDKKRAGLPIFIEISKENGNSNMLSFIQTQISFYKIKPSYLVITADTVGSSFYSLLRQIGVKLASRSLTDCFTGACDYFLYDYHTAGLEVLDEITEVCNKHNITIIVTGIDTKEDVDMARRSKLKLIYGKFYKKDIRMKKLIENL